MSAFLSCARWTLLGFSAALAVAFAASLQRLFPSVSALGAVGLLPTLALPLASLALELAVLGGVPLGFALGVRRAPGRWRALLPIPAMIALAGLLLARQVDVKEESPGRVVARLLAAADQRCSAGGTDRVDVPIVKITRHCGTRELHGAAPLGKGTFSARELRPSDDLGELAFRNLELDVPLASGISRLRIQADQAVVRGLPPWGRPRTASVRLRFVSIWAATLLTSALAAALARLAVGRAYVVLVGLGAGIALSLAALALDRMANPWLALGLLPLAGGGAAVVAALSYGLADAFVSHASALPLRRRRRAIARAAGRW